MSSDTLGETLTLRIKKETLKTVYKPSNYKERYVYTLWQKRHICDSLGVDYRLMIVQAITEQGWKITKGYRLFNIAGKGTVIYDSQVGQWREHKVYANLDDAIVDYCKLLNDRYDLPKTTNIFQTLDYMGNSGYAESKVYRSSLNTIYGMVSPILADIEGTEKERDVYEDLTLFRL